MSSFVYFVLVVFRPDFSIFKGLYLGQIKLDFFYYFGVIRHSSMSFIDRLTIFYIFTEKKAPGILFFTS